MEVQNAKDELQIAKLRKDAAANQSKDQKRRMEDLKKADELEKGIMKRRMQYAKTDLENARKKAAQSQNDAATNDELAQKEAAYYQAQTAYYQGTMRMASGISSAEKSLANDVKATGNAATDQAQKIEEAKKKELAAVRSAEDAITKLIKDEYARQRTEINLLQQTYRGLAAASGRREGLDEDRPCRYSCGNQSPGATLARGTEQNQYREPREKSTAGAGAAWLPSGSGAR